MTNTRKEIVFNEALLNAYKYRKADPKIVLKKIMANHPEMRKHAKEIIPEVNEIVSEVNNLPYEKIKKLAEERFPEEIIKPEKAPKKHIPDLPGATEGKVKVRYPPEPSKHPHIGQMLSFCINDMIAEKYKGKRVLRYDDTNPEKARLEYYDSFREAITWMDLKIDEEVIASNYMNTYYNYARSLLEKAKAYVCLCEKEKIALNRREGKACPCRNHTVEQNLELFDKMLEGHFNPGEAVVRFKGDMQSKNTVLRDPVILRISHTPHCIQGDRYLVWPMYDFESPIMEHVTGVSHVLRSIEFGKMREELHTLIAKSLSLRIPYIYEYSRFNIVGAPTKGRVIRELVEEGIVEGWDDIRLVTYQALRKRGIQPQVFKEIIKRVGMTKSTTTIDWSLIAAINRQIIEPTCKHFFFVEEPVKIELKNSEPTTLNLPLHPDNKAMGTREIKIENIVFISNEDIKSITSEKIIRLKDFCNIKILSQKDDKVYEGEILGNELLPKIPRVQWVSEHVQVEIKKPEMLYLNNRINKDSMKYIVGYGEKSLKTVSLGEIIQFERFGYVKLNEKNNVLKMNYVHG
ncbi:MAG: glutamate--tRNA ligase [Candidatus Heimdallarchaeaceae archaeon]